MSAAVLSGLRDYPTHKALRSQRSTAELQQLCNQLTNAYSPSLASLSSKSPNITITTTTTVSLMESSDFPSRSPTKHPPLIGSNSVAISTGVSNHSKGVLSKEHRKLDRSASEPLDHTQQPRPSLSNSSRYKTELCRPFEESGTCKYGDKCQFAHGINELRSLARHPKYKTELCRTFHSSGLCPYGPRCHFIHNDNQNSMAATTPLQQSNNINIPSNPLLHKQSSSNDYNCTMSYSLGSAGDLSPTSSSISGSPPSVNGFFPDEVISVYSQLSPPMIHQDTSSMISSCPVFYNQDLIAYAPGNHNIMNQCFLSNTALQQQQMDTLDSTLDNYAMLAPMNSCANDANRNNNIRLPIFSRLAFGGLN